MSKRSLYQAFPILGTSLDGLPAASIKLHRKMMASSSNPPKEKCVKKINWLSVKKSKLFDDR